jgi:hypothetical protein
MHILKWKAQRRIAHLRESNVMSCEELMPVYFGISHSCVYLN